MSDGRAAMPSARILAPSFTMAANTMTDYVGGPPTWNPGDVMLHNIIHDGSDTNGGNVYIYGVSFDFDADM